MRDRPNAIIIWAMKHVRPLRTIVSAIKVPPADKMTQRHVQAFAKAAAHHNARILLQNGLRISPDGTVDRPCDAASAAGTRHQPGAGTPGEGDD